jgi:hypothetical protein
LATPLLELVPTLMMPLLGPLELSPLLPQDVLLLGLEPPLPTPPLPLLLMLEL